MDKADEENLMRVRQALISAHFQASIDCPLSTTTLHIEYAIKALDRFIVAAYTRSKSDGPLAEQPHNKGNS